jgi:hypothetical protein
MRDSAPEPVMVSVFNDLARLPRHREALEAEGKPHAVVELRLAAAEADAVLLGTSYHGRFPLDGEQRDRLAHAPMASRRTALRAAVVW